MKAKSQIEKQIEKIALNTLSMSKGMIAIMGGLTRPQAINTLKKLGYSDEEIKKQSL